jgi:DNA gyrase/topoisomerase IV subunit B
MPLYRRLSDKAQSGITIHGYEMVWDPRSDHWLFTHLVSDWYNRWRGVYSESDGDHCHHIDFNKLNNNPSNLRRMPAAAHLELHRLHVKETLHRPESIAKWRANRSSEQFRASMSRRMKEPETSRILSEQAKAQWQDEEYKRFMLAEWRRFYETNEAYRDETRRILNEAQTRYWADDANRQAQSDRVKDYFMTHPDVREEFSKRSKEQWSDGSLRKWRSKKTSEQWTPEFRARRKATLEETYYRKTIAALKETEKEGQYLDLDAYQALRLVKRDKSLLRFDSFCRRYFDGDEKRARLAVANYNHRIESVEVLDEKIDVYDLEVPGTNNFALSAGVFVHNSAKQGRDRRTQAVLPLKGKILNVEKSRFDKMLSHSEIKALITALGTGIGKDDFDLHKLRYHKIILMTDADVDGSHIRTLLLTFFYRQMPRLVADLTSNGETNGYVYIAQPPLYKVKKGKTERYIKDEREMNRYLMKKATEDLKVINKGGETLEGRDLTALLEKLVEFNGLYSKLERRLHDHRIVDIALETLSGPKGLLRKEARKLHDVFKDEALLGKVAIALEQAGFKTELTSDEEHGLSEIEVHTRLGGGSILIDWELATHVVFQRAIELYKLLDVLHEPPFTVKENGNETSVSSRNLLLEHILAMAKKDLHIQRYKGLGEMNPEQLWDTTMNPETRTLLQVKIDDVVETDEIFTVLMGDQVEPRRKFIEDNALDVKNLDI